MHWALGLAALVGAGLAGGWVYHFVTRNQRECFHHRRQSPPNPLGAYGAESFITAQLIDFGRTKSFTCGQCGQVWFV